MLPARPDRAAHHGRHGDVAGAVLTGGRSRRMGRDKALVEVGGRPMAVRVADALASAGCAPVFAVGGNASALGAAGLAVIDEAWPGEGPVGAIITALAHSAVPTVVAACDLPWLDATTVRALVAPDHGAGADVVLAVTDRDEPMCACWMPTALVPLRHWFDAGGRAVHVALAELVVRRVRVGGRALRNVNTPGDLPAL